MEDGGGSLDCGPLDLGEEVEAGGGFGVQKMCREWRGGEGTTSWPFVRVYFCLHGLAEHKPFEFL